MIRYFSVDEEFSGLNHLKNDLLSIGMIEILQKSTFQIDYTRQFYLELKPLHDEYSEESMKINGLDLEKLKQHKKNNEEVIANLEDRIKETEKELAKLTQTKETNQADYIVKNELANTKISI